MPTSLVRADSLTFAYPGGREVLAGISMEVNRGEMIAVVGPSGSGKSTLLYLLAGMLRPTKGRITAGGVQMSTLRDAERSAIRARSFGFVFQDAALDPRRSVLDSILEPCLYAGIARSEMEERARMLVAALGVDVDLTSRPGQVSGGQAQRIGVCRALLLAPPMVLADEPTGNLDSSSADAVMAAFGRVVEGGGSVLIATHDDRVIESCHRAIEVG